ncbi:UNVERIFIED_CONTAM: hypothetical protein PYX00_005685 [Menopon gallinae]|uniref:G-protein coupled receptors family 1 profile domain-containing protein n=1 Tax=Menopon gallinae TaxID=328185 RepID=A0AAW2HTF7_9NEOP
MASIGLPRNFYLCLFTVSLLIVLCTISIFCLVAVSIDRYWAILHPMSYSRNVSSRTAIGIIIVCWLAGTLVGFLPLLGWNEGGSLDGKCLFVKVMDYDYLVFLYFATIIIPAILLAAFYTHIYRVVLNQLRQIVMLSPRGQPGSPGRSSGVMLRMLGAAQKREVKATQNLAIIVLFFIICWIPLYTINCVKAFCKDCEISQTLTNSCIILSHLNSSFNPFLYAYHLKDFRVALRSLLFGNKTILGKTRSAPHLPRGISIHIQRPVRDGAAIANSPNHSKSSANKETESACSEKEEISDSKDQNRIWSTMEIRGEDGDGTDGNRFGHATDDDVFVNAGESSPDGIGNLSRTLHSRSRSLQHLRSDAARCTRYCSESVSDKH